MSRTLLLIASLVFGSAAFAQQAELGVSTGPHYAEVPIDVLLTVEDFERSPEPKVEVTPPVGASLELVGVSPNFSSSIQIINGRVTQSETVQFVFRYRLTARQAGVLELGPFRVVQGTTTAEARKVSLEIEDIPTTTAQRFRLVIPEGPLWVGQRIPITIEWWLSESFAERLAGRRARVPLFDLVDRFSFEDLELAGARSMLTVDTAAGPIDLPMEVGRGEWEGESYLVVSAKRIMIPLRAMEMTLAPAFIVTEETVRWSTDFFGNRVPAGVRRLRVEDAERSLVVRAPPANGRPLSFSGAVGQGFSIESRADRSVVQTGDPIRLTLEVRGDAALDTVSLPRLAQSGLDSDDFKIPEQSPAGTVENGVKRFELVLRVKNEQVEEIPPIALSWFDPSAGEYRTTRSRPIALSVRPAVVVTATDVVRPTLQEPDQARDEAESPTADGDPMPPNDARVPRPLSLTGAELAVETRLDRLQADPIPVYARPLVLAAIYGGGIAILGLAVLARRRAALDPATRARRRALESGRRDLTEVASVGDLARVLREMALISPARDRKEYEAVLVECDNLAYAPGGGHGTAVGGPLRTRALAVADAMVEASR